MAVKIQVCVTA